MTEGDTMSDVPSFPSFVEQAQARPPKVAIVLGSGMSCVAEGCTASAQVPFAEVPGPCYETPAEIRALKSCGADAVGMSTAREIQAGCDLGMECAAVSCITNRAAGLSTTPINHEEVLTTAAAQAQRLASLLEA